MGGARRILSRPLRAPERSNARGRSVPFEARAVQTAARVEDSCWSLWFFAGVLFRVAVSSSGSVARAIADRRTARERVQRRVVGSLSDGVEGATRPVLKAGSITATATAVIGHAVEG